MGLVPFTGEKIFMCNKCGGEMLEDGTIVLTLKERIHDLMERVEAFRKWPEIKDAMQELQEMIAQNKKVAAKHRKEIEQLLVEMNKINADKDLLIEKIKKLREKIKADT